MSKMYPMCLYLFYFTFLLLASTVSYGQDLYYTIIDKNNGLPTDEIYDLFQDDKGFIWLAHNDGLSRYDGYECKNYVHSQQSSRSGTNIQQDGFGRIWYQNFDGRLYYVVNDSMFALQQSPPVGYVQYGMTAKQLYVFQKEGVDVFDLKTLQILQTIPFDTKDVVYNYSYNGYDYILEKKGLYVIDDNYKLKFYPYSKDLSEDIPSIMESSSNQLLSISRFNQKQQVYQITKEGFVPKFTLPKINMIQNLCFQGGYFWFCTPTGVYAYTEDGEALNRGLPFFAGKSITSVVYDREGNFWFGTKKSGVLFVPDLASMMAFEQIQPSSLLTVGDLLYIGTQDGRLFKSNPFTYSLQQIYQDKDQHELALLGYDNLTNNLLVSGKNFGLISVEGTLKKECVAAVKSAVRINSKYHALAISGTVGLSCFEENETSNEWDTIYQKYITDNVCINAQMVLGTRGKSVVYNATTNSVYFASSNGLWKATPTSLYEITPNDSSIFLQKLCLVGQTIYGYNTNGVLLKIDTQDKVENVRLETHSKRIKNIKQQQHFLLVLTEDELFFADTRNANLEWKKSHLYSTNINDFILWNDQLIIANKNGLLIQKFEQKESREIAPLWRLNNIKVNNIIISDNTQLQQLAYHQNNIEVQYSILSFKTKSKFPLYYQINNSAWELAPEETRLLKLAALSPGAYTIKFCLGEPNSSQYLMQSIAFRILLPWWQEWWFWTLCFFVIASLAYAYYYQKTQLLIQQNKLLSEKIVLEQDLSNSTLKAIKSQMNPHFFYNALNTIQFFIYADDKKNAAGYLSKFSKLTRLILEMSDKEKIPLSEEIDALNLYLDIEKARFNDDFEYKVTLDQNLDKELIRIPSMLLQPYVENAIKHGLLHQNGHKKLTIVFQIEANFLKVTITDNGIGRKKSEELKKVKSNKHTSFSSNANATRLAILNRGKESKTGVEYIDHVNEKDQSMGTSVIITIPIK